LVDVVLLQWKTCLTRRSFTGILRSGAHSSTPQCSTEFDTGGGDMNEKKVFKYPGQLIDIQWDGRLCIHIAECGQSEGELFVGGRDPWCLPDSATPAHAAEVCERCPSGALAYFDNSGQQIEQQPDGNTVNVTYNGPLFVHGELDIEGIPEDMPGVQFRAALCRCGHSKNKPFCDNSHLKIGFEDYGAIGENGPGVASTSGKLGIKPLPDGPLLFSGGVSLIAGSGRTAWRGDKVALCRCGASKNKPFCDGSHKTAGFRGN
jgi:CDGSH-type Zn-finger protein/uncharacterized Fe-S cluster protein YjdI